MFAPPPTHSCVNKEKLLFIKHDLKEDHGLKGTSHLFDGVFVSQSAIWAGAHVHVRREVVTFRLHPRTVGHVEVQTPKDSWTVFCRRT